MGFTGPNEYLVYFAVNACGSKGKFLRGVQPSGTFIAGASLDAGQSWCSVGRVSALSLKFRHCTVVCLEDAAFSSSCVS